MERLFLCCFRSCLKGDNDKEYYEVLEISDPHRATTDQIKKQYKKLSLTLHPDKLAQKGIEVTPEHKQQFLKLKEAYDILSDPKKRRLYDEYGPMGLKLIENPTEISHVDLLKNFQKNRGDRTSLALFIAFIFACVLLLPILFSLKCDGTLGDNAPWVAIWSPMWLVDLFLIFSSVYIIFDNEDDKAELNEDGERIEKKEEKDKIPMTEKLANLITTALFILIQIFVLIRMDGYTDWSWFAVFAPWFIYEFIVALVHLPTAFKVVPPPSYDNIQVDVEEGQNPEEEIFMVKIQKESEYFEKLMERQRAQKTIIVTGLRAWQAIFLAIELNGAENWNWGLVFLPIWIYIFVQYLYAVVFRVWGSSKLQGLDAEAIMSGGETDPLKLAQFQQGNDLMSNSFFLCIAQAVPLFMAIMLVCRLEVSTYSTFLIILPVFLFIGCCCCIVFCGLLCLSVVDTNELEEEIAGGKPAGANGNAQAGEEGGYSPPVVVTPEPPADQQVSNNNAAYGTFDSKVNPEPQQSPLIDIEHDANDNSANSEKSTTHLLPVTTIDADID